MVAVWAVVGLVLVLCWWSGGGVVDCVDVDIFIVWSWYLGCSFAVSMVYSASVVVSAAKLSAAVTVLVPRSSSAYKCIRH